MSDNDTKKVSRTDCEAYKDAETLRWLYHGRDLSSRDAGDVLGVTKSAVLYWMDKHDIERRPGRYRDGPWRDEETLRTEYVEKGRSANALADEWDTTDLIIYNWLDRHGIDHRHGPRTGGDHPNYGITGEDHWCWKGGFDRHYGANWYKQTEKARKRDNHECQRCGIAQQDCSRALDVHHRKRLGWFKKKYDAPEWWEKGNRLSNLVTLCDNCHRKVEQWPVQPVVADDA